jgi:hypothetical protein
VQYPQGPSEPASVEGLSGQTVQGVVQIEYRWRGNSLSNEALSRSAFLNRAWGPDVFAWIAPPIPDQRGIDRTFAQAKGFPILEKRILIPVPRAMRLILESNHSQGKCIWKVLASNV